MVCMWNGSTVSLCICVAYMVFRYRMYAGIVCVVWRGCTVVRQNVMNVYMDCVCCSTLHRLCPLLDSRWSSPIRIMYSLFYKKKVCQLIIPSSRHGDSKNPFMNALIKSPEWTHMQGIAAIGAPLAAATNSEWLWFHHLGQTIWQSDVSGYIVAGPFPGGELLFWQKSSLDFPAL